MQAYNKTQRRPEGVSSALPLDGKRIVVTRPRDQSANLVAHLQELGATPIECPAISIAPLRDTTRLDEAIGRLDSCDWVIFTSANGVKAFTERMAALGRDRSVLCARKLAAIGPATRSAIEKLGCRVSFVPDAYVAEAIVEQIEDVAEKRVLLPRADIARGALAAGLAKRGALVDEVAAYHTLHGDQATTLAALLRAGAVDAMTFTSSSTVRYTIEALIDTGLSREEAVALMDSTTIVCIGPITAGTAEECGLQVTAVAEEYTTRGLVEALVKHFAPDAAAAIEEQRDA
jgi:uroporphyrinogen III methyltransferase/synthase